MRSLFADGGYHFIGHSIAEILLREISALDCRTAGLGVLLASQTKALLRKDANVAQQARGLLSPE